VRFTEIPPGDDESGLVNVVIDTPRGSRNKYKVDEELGLFKLSRILPEGHYFPFDFGSIPGTRSEDGDALDVMVLLDEPAFPGCLVQVRLIAVPVTEVNKPEVRKIEDVDPARLEQLEYFFVSYNLAQGRKFRPGRPQGPKAAGRLLRAALARFRRQG
jgi:inorganic pyrophosphatase